MKFAHTNIIAKDWITLSNFYINVFGCKKASSEQNLSGEYLSKATNVEDASLKGIQLSLPGYEKGGPLLEIFQYDSNVEKDFPPTANREGYGHIAFHVDNVEEVQASIIEHGGKKFGEIVRKEFPKGTLIFTYATDPEGNIIELMSWEAK